MVGNFNSHGWTRIGTLFLFFPTSVAQCQQLHCRQCATEESHRTPRFQLWRITNKLLPQVVHMVRPLVEGGGCRGKHLALDDLRGALSLSDNLRFPVFLRMRITWKRLKPMLWQKEVDQLQRLLPKGLYLSRLLQLLLLLLHLISSCEKQGTLFTWAWPTDKDQKTSTPPKWALLYNPIPVLGVMWRVQLCWLCHLAMQFWDMGPPSNSTEDNTTKSFSLKRSTWRPKFNFLYRTVSVGYSF